MTSRIETLHSIFSYSRINTFNKGRACERIKEILCNMGYEVRISDESNHHIETLCDDPSFIIASSYVSSVEDNIDKNLIELISTLILSEKLNSYRKKVKFILLDKDKVDISLEQFDKDIKIVNLNNVATKENISILNEDKICLKCTNIENDIKNANSYAKIKEVVNNISKYIINEMW